MRSSRTPHSSYALLYLGEASGTPTAFDTRGARASGAFGTAIAAHIAIVLALWGAVRMQPAPPASVLAVAPSSIAPFIFTGASGPGGGPDRGGNHSADPVARLRTRGADPVAVPATAVASLATPDTIAPEREQMLALPVQPMNAGDLPQFGAVEGVPGPPTTSRGPGDGGVGTRPGSDRAGLGNANGPGGVGDGPGTGAGVSPPTLLFRALPQYTPEAMRAKLQGVAFLTGVVGVDGLLHDIRIVRSLDAAFGLDQEAIKCVRQWRFRPGTRLGKPVAVLVNLEVEFNLR
jgi:periplasmic protein TonB